MRPGDSIDVYAGKPAVLCGLSLALQNPGTGLVQNHSPP
jgi:hypothetical protein